MFIKDFVFIIKILFLKRGLLVKNTNFNLVMLI